MFIRNKQTLISFILKNARPAIRRSIEEGRVKVIGAFNPAPTTYYPGWVVKVWGKVQHWWIIVYVKDRHYHIKTVVDDIDIKSNRDGLNSNNPLYRGN